MRTATLYTLNEHVVDVYGDHVSFSRFQPLPDDFLLSCEGDIMTSTIDRIDVPIRRLCESVRDPENHTVRMVENYIAIDPKLEHKLTAQHREQVFKLTVLLETANNFRAGLEDRINAHNNLPWYKRIFHKV